MSVADDKHTPEPWSLLGAAIHTQGVLVKLKRRANAARIVACVNACAGTPSEDLGRWGFGGVRRVITRQTNRIAGQGAEIAALREVAEAAKKVASRSSDNDHAALRAALAKLEGLS